MKPVTKATCSGQAHITGAPERCLNVFEVLMIYEAEQWEFILWNISLCFYFYIFMNKVQ